MTKIIILEAPSGANQSESCREFIRRLGGKLPWTSPPYEDMDAVFRAVKLESMGFKTGFHVV